VVVLLPILLPTITRREAFAPIDATPSIPEKFCAKALLQVTPSVDDAMKPPLEVAAKNVEPFVVKETQLPAVPGIDELFQFTPSVLYAVTLEVLEDRAANTDPFHATGPQVDTAGSVDGTHVTPSVL
jgi:hypothetical protein